jgi:enolase
MEWMKMTGMDGKCLPIKLEIKCSWLGMMFVTNERLSTGIDRGMLTILVKVNQIGTLTETIAAVNMAKMLGILNVTSFWRNKTIQLLI